jgi:hypothetical protein
MSNPFKRGNWILLVGLICVLTFVFILAVGALADGKKGCSKTCPHKTSAAGCPMMMKASSEGKESGATQVLTLDSFSKAEQYACPMHPEVRSEKAGKCPECGMRLVKEDFYEVYRCGMEKCPHVKAEAGKCCGKDLQRTLMSKEEYYQFARLQDEYFCPMHAEVVSDEAGKCPKCGMKLEMKTVQKAEEEPQQASSYFCPMHPDQISDKAGICMKCGMKLREKKASSG